MPDAREKNRFPPLTAAIRMQVNPPMSLNCPKDQREQAIQPIDQRMNPHHIVDP